MAASGVDFSAIREAHSLVDYVPVEARLRKVGPDRWRGRCPIGDHAQGAFSVTRDRDGTERFSCFACGARGDVVDLVAALSGITTAEAARRLGSGLRQVTPEERLARTADAWRARRPAFGVLACDWCWESLAVEDWAAVAAARSAGWRLSASGRVAVCPAHSNETKATSGPREVVVAILPNGYDPADWIQGRRPSKPPVQDTAKERFRFALELAHAWVDATNARGRARPG